MSQTIEKFSIDNGGASFQNGNIQMLYTIGEVNVQEVNTTAMELSEGFINPNPNSQTCTFPATSLGFTKDSADCNDSSVTVVISSIALNYQSYTLVFVDISTGTELHLDHAAQPGVEIYQSFSYTDSTVFEWYWINNSARCESSRGAFYISSNCNTTDNDGDGFTADIDCNDNDSESYPLGPELCDGFDNNCNGLIDEEDIYYFDTYSAPLWLLDEDGDGWAVEDSQIRSCLSPGEDYFEVVGLLPSDYDCDDTDPFLNPETLWYWDKDGDGYAVTTIMTCEVVGTGYTTDELPLGDCDDYDASINPGITYECIDNKDNDCDGLVDEIEDLVIFLTDADNDGFPSPDYVSCTTDSNYYPYYVSNGAFISDCDDSDFNINPDATEILCNGIDENCNGLADDDAQDPVCLAQNITVELDQVTNEATISVNAIDVGSYDNCGIESMVLSQTNFNQSNIGENALTLTITDVNGNVSFCDFTVTVIESTLGVNDNALENLEFYPNPFDNVINIKIPQVYSNDEFQISLLDITGKKIMEIKAVSQGGLIQVSHIESLSQGIYILKINNFKENQHRVVKLVKS